MVSMPKPTRATYPVTSASRALKAATERFGIGDPPSPPVHTPPDEQKRPKIQKSIASTAVPFTPTPTRKVKLGPIKKETKGDAIEATGTSVDAAKTVVSQREKEHETSETGRRKRSRERPSIQNDSELDPVQCLIPVPRPTRAKHLVAAMKSRDSKPSGATEPSELTFSRNSEQL